MDSKLLTSLQNPAVKHLVKLRNDPKYRYEQQSLIVEGCKLIREIIPYIKRIYIEESFKDFPENVPETWIVSDAVMKKISGMTSPEGIVAEVCMPAFSSLKNMRYILALDGINDPGNLGTLMRTALALGWDGAYFLPDCCDPFNEKAVRSARGAQFRLPFARGSAAELHRLAIENNLTIYVADLQGSSPEIIAKEAGKILVLGNEARGASEEIGRFATRITIPMPGEMESLNVGIAGGILMYELK